MARLAEHQVGLHPGRRRRRARAASDVDEDVVGVIQYEFVDWRERESAHAILDQLRAAMTGIPGADVEVSVPNAGPPTGKAIQVQLSAVDPAGLDDAARGVADTLRAMPDVIDVSDGLPAPGVDWELEVDRARAAQYGVSTAAVGSVVQLVTNGLKLTDFRPAGADDAVDIRIRLPEDRRTFATLDSLRIETAAGSVPIANFVQRTPARTTGILTRIDGQRTVTVEAGIRAGVQADPVRQAVADGRRRHGPRRRGHPLEAGRRGRGAEGGRRLPRQRLPRGAWR